MAETRAYLDGPLSEGLELELSADVHRRLVQVLRMRAGEHFVAFDGRGYEFDASLSKVEKRSAAVQIGRRRLIDRESPLQVTLAQVVGKGERMDWAVQKAVEVGVHTVVPLLSERCNVSIDESRQAKRLQHWQGVVIAACEQCGRTRIPELLPFAEFTEWVFNDAAPVKLLLDGSGVSIGDAVPSDTTQLSLCVGPEGGFTEQEIEQARAAGYRIVRLGPRILRTETAGIASISALQTKLGDWR